MGKIVTVNFRGDELYGFENDDGTFVALKPLVECMGLDWSAQLKRVKRDMILSEGMAMMATPFGRGGDQECACLKLDLVNGWLFTIDASRIANDAVRDKVILYQRECYSVLARHFYGRPVKDKPAADDRPDDLEPILTRRGLVTEARQSFGIQSARELWFKLGLPLVPSMYADPRQGELFTYTAVKRDEPKGRAA